MPSTVNVGTLEGLLRWKTDDAELNKSLNEVARKANVSRTQLNQYNKELLSLTTSYNRVASSIDPSIAATQKYERAQSVLSSSLKAGIIGQEQHNKLLEQAKAKFLGVSHNTLTWREEIHHLTEKISGLNGVLGPLGPEMEHIGHSLSSLSSGFSALGGMLAELGPLILAAGVAFIAFEAGEKIFEFLKETTEEGLKTQKVIEKLNNTLHTTGSYSGMTGKELVELAEKYELLTGRGKEEIVTAETTLARFKSLNEESLPKAIAATLAYAKATDETADVAAKKLGPAFEGSTRSLNALKEAGIVFTASQRKSLQAMIDHGEITKYQALLFDLLKEKVGEVSEEYDKNLLRQMARFHIVAEEFKEAIASEIIPAFEDMLDEIVNSLGGWDLLKRVITETGHVVGNYIRVFVYEVMITYHEWEQATEALSALIQHSFSEILNVIGTAGKIISKPIDPFGTGILAQSSKAAIEASKAFADASSKSADEAFKHGEAIARLTGLMLEHRQALEGSDEQYKINTTDLSSLGAKAKELSKILQEQIETIRHLNELDTFYKKGPMDLVERLKGEEKINDAHEYRLDLLKYEEKFGEKVAKQLADTNQTIRELSRQVKIDLILSTKLELIKDNVLQDYVHNILGKSAQEAIKELDSVLQVELRNQKEYNKAQEEIDRQVTATANHWIDHFRTARDIADEEMEKVKQAVKDGLLYASEGERALAEIRESYIMAQMDQWQGLFSFIGGLFGGLAQKIASALNNIQSAYQQGKKLDASGFGGGMSGSWGAIFAEVQVFYEAYVAVSDIIKSHKAKTWGAVAELEIIKGQLSAPTYLNAAGREISNALRKMVQDIIDSLGAVVDNLPEIAIRARHDGKQFSAYVAGVWVGTFKDIQSAVDAGVASALEQATFSHISEEFKTALQKSLGATLEELKANLDIAKSARGARIGSTGSQYLDIADKWNSIISASRRLGLAVDDEIKARNRELQSLKMQALGIDTSTSDMLASLLSLNKGIGEASGGIKSTLEQQIADINKQIAAVEKSQQTGDFNIPGMGPKGDGNDRGPSQALLLSGTLSDANEEIDKTLADLKAKLADYTDQLNKVPDALSDQELNLGIFKALFKDIAGNSALSAKYAEESKKFAIMEVEIKYAQIKEQLILLGKWEEFAGMFNDTLAAARQAAIDGAKPTRGGRGGGGSEKDSVRDFIKDKTFDLSLVGLTDYEKQKAQIIHQYDEELDKAGKDKKLRDQLLALRDKEIKQLQDEQKEITKGKFREFMGLVTPFEKTRKTAADLIKEINGSPFGNVQKAAMIGRVMEELDRQLNTLSKQMTADLFGNMLSDMEKFGATDEQMRAAREAQAILQHELTMADYAVRIAQLEAEGRVSQETLATLHNAYDFLAGIDPTQFIGGGKGQQEAGNFANDNYSYTGTTFDDFQSLLKSVQDKLAEWNRIPLSETLSKAHELTDSYDKLMEDVNKLIPFGWDYRQQVNDSFRSVVSNFIDNTLSQFEDSGSGLEDQLRAIGSQFRDINSALVYLHASQEDLARAETDRLKAVNKLLSQYLDPINERLRSRQVGEHSILTPEQQYLNAQKQFRDLYAQIQSGDLSHISDVVSLADQYESLLRSSTGGGGLRAGLSEIDNALISIRDLVPEFAQQMAEVGTEDNPMVVDNRGMINAIQDNMEAVNNGNNLMLVELRDSVSEMRNQSVQLGNIERTLANPLSVRNVA